MKKMGLQDRMNSLKPYFKGIEMYNDALIVRVSYPSNWKAYGSADERIMVTPSDSDPNETYYYADSSKATYDDMFDLIEETVKANNEISMKLKLLQEKGEELKELFSTLSYDELLTLKFVTSSQKQSKRKPRKKVKPDVVEAVAEEPKVEDIEVIEEEEE